MKRFVIVIAGLCLAGAVSPALADGAAPHGPAVDSGDTAWMLMSTALVMLMTPGLALFYGGMVRRKNVLGTIMQSFIALGVVSVQWVLFGYSLSFGPDVHHVIGNLSWAGLNGVGLSPNPDYAATIPHQAFMIFQMMFAVITPALITGAIAERVKFSSYLVFLVLWSTLVYDPLAHWVWGTGGWLRSLGALDFAGGLVVHISSGVAALAAILVVGKRRGYGREPMPPHNLTMTILGTALLWFGWFGFNAGSAVASGALATAAFVTTHIATAGGALSWMVMEWLVRGTPSVLGAASGAVAGLVAVTPASGFVGPMPALCIGVVVGVLSFFAVTRMKTRLGYDDSLDVVGVHGVGGTWGALATGLFATTAVNAAGADGLFFGHAGLLGAQAASVLVVLAYSFGVTFILLKAIEGVMGLRVSDETEMDGLDVSLHGESGYHFGFTGSEMIGNRRLVSSLPAPDAASGEAPARSAPPAVNKPYQIVIQGMDDTAVKQWWEDLCSMDWRKTPGPFRDIYGSVSRLRGSTLYFWKGSPEASAARLEDLLSGSCVSGFSLRIVK